MGTFPGSWAAYAHYQSKLSRSFSVDSHVWGLEGALNVIIKQDFSAELTTEDQFRRAAGNASRKRRDHVARFLGAPPTTADAPDGFDLSEQIAAGQLLDVIEKTVERQEDRQLLVDVADGSGYAQLALYLGRPAASLRSRVLRLRKRLKSLLIPQLISLPRSPAHTRAKASSGPRRAGAARESYAMFDARMTSDI